MAAGLKVGDLVVVGQRYVMADHPPYIGNGRMIDDEWTGKVFRVVKICRPNNFGGTESADLAPDLVGVDESDAVVSIVTRNLSLVSNSR